MTTPSSNSDPPAGKKITLINSSMRCFLFSLVGLIPCIGLPFSVAAIMRSHKMLKAAGSVWNPAGRYLKAAARLSPLGILSTAVFLTVACMWAANMMSNPTAGPSGSG